MASGDYVYIGCEGDPDVGGTALGYVFQELVDCQQRCGAECTAYPFIPSEYRQVLIVMQYMIFLVIPHPKLR